MTSLLRQCECCTIYYHGSHPRYCDDCLKEYPHIVHLDPYQIKLWIWSLEKRNNMSPRDRSHYAEAYVNSMLSLGVFDLQAVGYCCREMNITPRTVRALCRASDLCPTYLYLQVFGV